MTAVALAIGWLGPVTAVRPLESLRSPLSLSTACLGWLGKRLSLAAAGAGVAFALFALFALFRRVVGWVVEVAAGGAGVLPLLA